MTARRKKPRDVNALAAEILREATDDDRKADDTQEVPEKDEAAAALARKRAAKLTPERRSEIAREAAKRRWKKS